MAMQGFGRTCVKACILFFMPVRIEKRFHSGDGFACFSAFLPGDFGKKAVVNPE